MVLEYKSLYITDEAEKARQARASGRYVVLSLPLIGDGLDLSAFPYAIENVEDVTPAYLDRLILRFEQKPWHILTTQRCLIREITVEDVDALYEIYKEPSITAYMEDLYEDYEEEVAYTKDYIACHYGFYEFGMWIIEDRLTHQIIGRAGLDMVAEKERPQLGFVVRKERQDQGIATEVCEAILIYAREELELVEIEASCHKENVHSIKLLQKLGFHKKQQEGQMLIWENYG